MIIVHYDDRYGVMMDCWKENPEQRPKFGELVHRLEDIILPVAPELPQSQQNYLRMHQHSNGNYMNAAYQPDESEKEYLELMRMSTPLPLTWTPMATLT